MMPPRLAVEPLRLTRGGEKLLALRVRHHMVGRAMLSPDELRAIRDQVTSELDEAVAFADASPFPDPKDLMADMFAP